MEAQRSKAPLEAQQRPRRLRGEGTKEPLGEPEVNLRFQREEEQYTNSQAMLAPEDLLPEKPHYEVCTVVTNEDQRRLTLDQIHAGMADFYLKKLQNGDLTASEQSCVLKFLNDNGARYGVVTSKSPIAELLASMPFKPGEYDHE